MKKYFLLVLILISTQSFAFILPDDYLSGEEVCEKNSDMRAREIFKWISVPVDYKNPNFSKTKIYTYTLKPFDHSLPTLIYFTGGPGVSSRNTEFDLSHTNIIFFEQRGISCSRPENEKLFLDPHFYSSTNTAKDALEILKSYNVKKVTVYGQSYGTVPATIFASLFPDVTQSLIIEGVIFQADESLWHSNIKKTLLQNFFNNLPKESQDKIIALSESKFLPENWFSKLGNMMLYMDDGISTFSTFLESVLSMAQVDLQSFISNFYPKETLAEEFSFGDVMMGMIGCQELSMANQDLSLTLKFENRKLVHDKINTDYKERCLPLKIDHIENNFYKAIDYPVSVPVFYLLGENDGATDLEQGLKHAKFVAKNGFKMLVMKNGGHLPNLGLLKDNRQCDPSEVLDQCDSLKQNVQMSFIFEKIIHNQVIDSLDIEKFNASGSLNWILNYSKI